MHNRRPVALLAVPLAAALIASAQLLPGLLGGPNFDASVFLLIGERLLDGTRPYAQLWDHKPPGIYLIDAGLIASVGALVGAWPAIWIGTVVAHATTGLVVIALLSGRVRRSASITAGILAVAVGAAWPFALGGGLTESFAAPFAAGSWLVASRARTWRGWGISGVLLVLAAGISLYAVPAGLAVVAMILVRDRPWQSISVFTLGATFVAVLGFAVAFTTGVGLSMLDALVQYNAAYRASSMAAPLPESLAITPALLGWYGANAIALLVPAAIGIFSRTHRPFVFAALAWLIGSGVMIGAGGRLYGHYLALVVPPLAILAGLGIARALSWATSWHRIGLALLAALLLGINGAATYAAFLASAPDAYSHQERDREAAMFVAERTDPGDPILVWGNAPMIYHLSSTAPAWRYPYLLPLLTPEYVTDELVEGLRADLETSPPCLIVDAGSPAPGHPGLPPLLIDRPLTPSERRVDLLDPIRAFVDEHYGEPTKVDGWPIYQLESRSC